jgi:hypothetical protein
MDTQQQKFSRTEIRDLKSKKLLLIQKHKNRRKISNIEIM